MAILGLTTIEQNKRNRGILTHRPVPERAAGHGHRVRIIVAEPNAGSVRARDAGTVARPRAVDAIAVDLMEMGDSLADVEDGGEGRFPRYVAKDIAFHSRVSWLDVARPGEIRLVLEDLRFDML
ncbi:hypothetical protein RRF57_003989 [Xylaria bambusicola]|uniref:Uncharacterized protein n=1 Tax=Xylaria bambusicola TaxID=326684 RepID=A0AAN7U9E7_9PEZI